jgi:glucokinase
VTQQPGGSGNDVIGDFQRWLLRAGARGMSRELADQVRTALGKTQQKTGGDVWKTATTEPAPGEAPECAWCPLCRAARLVREAKPTRDTRVAAVGDALTTVVQDAGGPEAARRVTSRANAAPAGRKHRVPTRRQHRALTRRQHRFPTRRPTHLALAGRQPHPAPARRQRRARTVRRNRARISPWRRNLRKNPRMSLTIGVDVGGTKVAAGVVDERGRIVEKLRRATPAASPERTAAAIAAVVTELLGRHAVTAVGVGAAGFVDEAGGTVAFAPNLAWRGEPLRAKVTGLVGLPVTVENDGNASAWAEFRFGAARGHAHVTFVSVGTGIGAGFILDGRLYRGRWGMAAEPGHFRVVPDGRLCGCGNRGCWEQYASGSALVTEARDIAMRAPGGAMRLLQLAGGDAAAIGGPQITQAAREGDPAALRCFSIVGTWLGQGLADLAAILDPGCIVVGGGVSEAGELLLGPARAAFERALTGAGYRPRVEIARAALGEDAGIVGAADLVRNG